MLEGTSEAMPCPDTGGDPEARMQACGRLYAARAERDLARLLGGSPVLHALVEARRARAASADGR